MDKQIFAAVEICDHEIRLIVGEFFNTRFNIIKTNRIDAYGLSCEAVVDQNAIVEALKKAVDNASKTIGARIERVLLCIPSYRVKCVPLKVRKHIDSIDGCCTALDIKDALKRAMQTKVPNDLALIQAVPIKYTVNGISTRRLPINERCDELVVDVDLLCADRKFAFDLVECVEKAGLEVMDIALDTFAIAKEGALFEQAIKQNIIILKMERVSTSLASLQKGKLVACDTYRFGLNKPIGQICDKFSLSGQIGAKLLLSNVRVDLSVYSDNPIYIYAINGQTQTISENQLVKCIQGDLKIWLDGIESLCKPILQQGQTTVIITSEGAQLMGLDHLLQERLNVEVKSYTPETLGVRNSSLTACLGLFYAYKDQLPITNYQVNSVDMDAFMKTINYKANNASNDPEESITQKLKGILFETKK